jgi:hypothetical protein
MDMETSEGAPQVELLRGDEMRTPAPACCGLQRWAKRPPAKHSWKRPVVRVGLPNTGKGAHAAYEQIYFSSLMPRT